MPQAALPRNAETTSAIRAIRKNLTMGDLRRLREELYRLQLQAIEDMIVDGVDGSKIVELGSCAAAIAALEILQSVSHERQR